MELKHRSSVYEDTEPKPEVRVPEQEARETPLFVTDPPAPSRKAVVELDEMGNPKPPVECEDAEAASHWDRRLWRRLR